MTMTEAVERRLIETKAGAAIDFATERLRHLDPTSPSRHYDWASVLVGRFGVGKGEPAHYPVDDHPLRARHAAEIAALWQEADEENRVWDLIWDAGFRVVVLPPVSNQSIEDRLDSIMEFLQSKMGPPGEWAPSAAAGLATRLFRSLAGRETDVFSGRALEVFVDTLSMEYTKALLSAANGDGQEIAAGLLSEKVGPSSLSLIIEVTNMLRTEHKKPKSLKAVKAEHKKPKNK